ncbi:MAG: hypothetical protein A2001_04845 [Treponema sp. GWC1_61_84]|nr:MAG: hypothetical protein A2001_04845 [Treponema sp. GWC1_61_84]
MTKRGPFLALILFALAIPGFALEGADGPGRISAQIVYAEGKDFTIVRGGVARTFRADGSEVVGMDVEAGDLVQTGSLTFVEMQLAPSGSMIKIAENTSFSVDSFGASDGSVSLSLVYGRVRAKVAKLSGTDSFRVRTRGVAAGVRGTDFGMDSIATRVAGKTEDRAYCFAGELEVYPEGAVAAGVPAMIVNADELLLVDLSSGLAVLERRTIDKAIKAFWLANEFEGKPPLPAPPSADLSDGSAALPASPASAIAPRPEPVPAAAPPAATASEAAKEAPAEAAKEAPAEAAQDNGPEVEMRYALPDYEPYRRAASTKNVMIGVSLVCGIIGLGLQSVGLYSITQSEYDLGTMLVAGGSAGVGISLGTAAAALFINPPSP